MVVSYVEAFGYREDLGNAAFWAEGRWRPPTMLRTDAESATLSGSIPFWKVTHRSQLWDRTAHAYAYAGSCQ